MKKKKRELIDILLDNVKPEDWPKNAVYAAQDKETLTWGKWVLMFYSDFEIPHVNMGRNSFAGEKVGKTINLPELCKHWSKTIVHRDEFMKRWNEHNAQNDNKPTLIGRITWNNGKFIFDDFIESPIDVKYCDEFVKQWNERNSPVEIKTLTFSREGIDPVTLTEKMEKISITPNVDSEGWIQWNGGEMPVEKGTLVDVKYRGETENVGVTAGVYGCSTRSNKRMSAFNWRHSGGSGDIIAYRIHVPQQQKTPQQLALEKFGTDWHDNEGVQPVEMGIKIDVTFNNGYVEYRVNSCLRWDKSNEGYSIEKWRIHSDDKESHADHGVKPLAFDDGPMASEQVCNSPLSTQIGGDHYTKLAIQPMQYSMENGLDPLQHTIIKYVTRFRDKAGIEDLEKAKHCIDMLIEFERDK